MKKRHSLLFLFGLLTLTVAACGSEFKLDGHTAMEVFHNKQVVKLVNAAIAGDYTEVDALVKSGVNVNFQGEDGLTPLAWVLVAHKNAAAEKLLELGANPNLKMARYASVTYILAGGNNPATLEMILKHGGDPNISAGDKTALDIAVIERRWKNYDLLVKYGADINTVDEDGLSPVDRMVILSNFDRAASALVNGYSKNLNYLAKLAEERQVPKDSTKCQWKIKVLNMLKARGVGLPAFKLAPGIKRFPDPCLPSYYPASWRE